MNALEWQRMKGVLTGALAIPPSERAAFLAGACPDEEMRRRAESLLVDADSAAAFLETPALEAAAAILEASAKHAPALTPGQRLGRYEILLALGTGGMGEVYRARDSKLRRDVAVKVLPGVRVGGSRTPFAVRARGERGRGAVPSQHPLDLRFRERGRRRLRRHGASGRQDAAREARCGSDIAEEGGGLRAPSRQGSCGRP